MVIFHYPWVLLGFLPLLVFAGRLIAWRDHSPHKSLKILLTGTAVLALLAGSQPIIVLTHRPENINIIVDDSASTATAFFRNLHRLHSFIRHHAPPGTHIRLGFIGHHLRWADNKLASHAAGVWPKSFPSSSAQHLNWHILAKAHLSTPTWIFTTPFNRWATTPPVRPIAITVFHPKAPDIGVSDLHIRRMSDGAAKLGILIRASGAIHATLNVRRNSVVIAQKTVKFSRPGEQVVELVDHLPHVSRWLRYRVRLHSADPWPMDNRGSVMLPPARPARLLWVTGHPHQIRTHKNIQLIRPAGVPTRASKLIGYRCVVLDNIPSWKLRAAQATALNRWVQNDFGGLVIVGARRAFGTGGYAADTSTARCLNALSPLSSHLPHPSPVGVAILIDASGSMGRRVPGTGGQTRFGLAVAGVLHAMRTIGPGTNVRVMVFGGRTMEIAGRTSAGLKRRLMRIEPNGPTRPDTALPILHRVLRRHDWVILLTDGGIPRMSPHPWLHLLQGIAGHMIIIAGRESHAIHAFLHAPHVKLLRTDSELRWRLILQKAMRHVLQASLMPTPLNWTTTSALGHQMSGRARQWVRTYIRRHAILLAVNRRSHIPLAAYWPVGLGKVASVAFEGGTRSQSILLRQIIHLVAASAANPHWRISLHPVPCQRRGHLHPRRYAAQQICWRLRVQASRARDVYQNVRALIINNHRSKVLPLSMVAPGVYQAHIDSTGRDFYITIMSGQPEPTRSPRYRLIGQVWPLSIPGPWFPATGTPTVPRWKGSVIIQSGKGSHTIWRPQISVQIAFANWLWIMAAICGAGAMVAGGRKSPQLGPT